MKTEKIKYAQNESSKNTCWSRLTVNWFLPLALLVIKFMTIYGCWWEKWLVDQHFTFRLKQYDSLVHYLHDFTDIPPFWCWVATLTQPKQVLQLFLGYNYALGSRRCWQLFHLLPGQFLQLKSHLMMQAGQLLTYQSPAKNRPNPNATVRLYDISLIIARLERCSTSGRLGNDQWASGTTIDRFILRSVS